MGPSIKIQMVDVHVTIEKQFLMGKLWGHLLTIKKELKMGNLGSPFRSIDTCVTVLGPPCRTRGTCVVVMGPPFRNRVT